MSNIFQTSPYKIILHEQTVPDKITLTAEDELSRQTFEASQHLLTKIKRSTIEAAFQKETPNLKYHLQREGNDLVLTIQVSLDYIPSFSETITLKQIEGASGSISSLKAQTEDLKKQLTLLEKEDNIQMIEHQIKMISQQNILMQVGAGYYLCSLTGFIVPCQYTLDNQEFYGEFDFSKKLTVILKVKEAQKQQKQYKWNMTVNSYYYESPIFLTQTIKATSAAQIQISFIHNMGWCPSLKDCIVTLQKAGEQ